MFTATTEEEAFDLWIAARKDADFKRIESSSFEENDSSIEAMTARSRHSIARFKERALHKQFLEFQSTIH
jgi:hypothetical protein